MPISSIRQLAFAAAFCCVALPAAHAQVTTTLNYNLALSDAVISHFHFYDDQPCDYNTNTIYGPNRYRIMSMTVAANGTYNFYDKGYDNGDGNGQDGTLGIYSGSFNPADPGSACVASVDDNQDVTLAPGTYTLVLTSWSGVGGDGGGDVPGSFRYIIKGPAAVTFSDTVAAVPTLAEWGLALLAALAAAMGMRGLRRRSA